MEILKSGSTHEKDWFCTPSRTAIKDGSGRPSIAPRLPTWSSLVVDPRPPYYRRNAFDIGEYGLGSLANSLELGCDCLGEIRYFDAVLSNARGQAVTIKNAICLHEEDAGLLWKHFDWRTGNTEVRRSRRLVISFIATVSNYEYGFFWYLYQDGNIELEIKLTGIISNGAVAAGDEPPWGELVAPGVYGPIHQHFFNVRLNMMMDGPSNSVYEVNTEADPPGPANASGTAYRAVPTLLRTEGEAQRMIDPFKARYWRIVNPNVINSGKPVGYKLVPGENTVPFANPNSSVIKRAGFITKHLWVTRYDPRERFGAGNYPNQDVGGKGLPLYAADNSSVTTRTSWCGILSERITSRGGGLAGYAGRQNRLYA